MTAHEIGQDGEAIVLLVEAQEVLRITDPDVVERVASDLREAARKVRLLQAEVQRKVAVQIAAEAWQVRHPDAVPVLTRPGWLWSPSTLRVWTGERERPGDALPRGSIPEQLVRVPGAHVNHRYTGGPRCVGGTLLVLSSLEPARPQHALARCCASSTLECP